MPRNVGRLLELHRLLVAQQAPVSSARIQERLGCSRATAIRLIGGLRDLSRDPIPYDRFSGGYAYLAPDEVKKSLPYLWFSSAELYALLVLHHQLQSAQPGLFASLMGPLAQRLEQMLEDSPHSDDVSRRVRLVSNSRSRNAGEAIFPICAEAVFTRVRLAIRYRSRTREQDVEREVSPSRLIAYRENWYLDAWCHVRDGVRRFAVERIQDARLTKHPALEIPEAELDACHGSGYGIFSGPATATAVLRFSAVRARWVADENWHPDQQGRYLDDGRYELQVPYGEPAELIMEILKHVPDVEVVEPESLRAGVLRRLQDGIDKFLTGS